jgi:hypothetical protein
VRGPFSRLKYAACDRVIAVSRAVAHGLVDDGLPMPRVLRAVPAARLVTQRGDEGDGFSMTRGGIEHPSYRHGGDVPPL